MCKRGSDALTGAGCQVGEDMSEKRKSKFPTRRRPPSIVHAITRSWLHRGMTSVHPTFNAAFTNICNNVPYILPE